MNNTLLDKPINQALLMMAAPAAIGMLMTFLFQLVDTYFIGQLGTAELAAISFAYPVYFFIISFFMGASAGVSAVVGKALGERKLLKAQTVTALSIMVFMLLTIVLGWVGYYSVPQVFSLLGANDAQLILIGQYMQPLYLGMFTLVGTLIANAALMAKGVMVKTTIVMGISGVINLVLDYILIFGMGPIPAMALQGAAIATVVAWSVGLCLMLLLANQQRLISRAAIISVHSARAYLREVKQIAIPAIAAQVLNPIAIAVVTRVVSRFGDNAVAAYGIVTRIESLGLTGILALSVIMTPIVAQNFGAKQGQRLDQVIAYAGRMTVYWGILLYILMLMFGRQIIGIFSVDTEVIHYGQMYFYIVGFSLPGFGLLLITTSFFNGVQQAKSSLKLTLVKSLGLTIPLAIIGAFFSITAVWVALAVANMVAAIYAGRVLKRWLQDHHSELLDRAIWKDYRADLIHLFQLFKRH